MVRRQNTRSIFVGDSADYVLTATDYSGCVFQDTIRLRNQPRPDPALNGMTKIFCKGGSIVLDAGAGFNWYSWSTGETTQTIIAKEQKKYNVAVLNDYGCGSKDSIYTQKDSMPPFNWTSYAISPKIFEFQASVIGPYDYFWDFGDGSTSKAIQTSHYFQNAGTYKVCLVLTNSNSCSDIVCKMVNAFGTKELPGSEKQIQIYPNPFQDLLNISMKLNGVSELSVTVYDVLGKELYKTENEILPAGDFLRTIDLKDLFLSDGIYQAKVTVNSVDYFIKLVHLR